MKYTVFIIAIILSISLVSFAQDEFSGEWYLGFQHQKEAVQNQFQLKRAYITYRKEITP